MGELVTVAHDGSEITLSMIKWGAVRRWMLSKTRGSDAPARFVPEYEIAIYEGSPKVVLSKNPIFKFFYRDKETALEKLDELAAIIKQDGLNGDGIWEFASKGDPRKQGFLGKLPSLREKLLAAAGES
jgi:hypothetical protein